MDICILSERKGFHSTKILSAQIFSSNMIWRKRPKSLFIQQGPVWLRMVKMRSNANNKAFVGLLMRGESSRGNAIKIRCFLFIVFDLNN